jgi:serine/threonine protein kinase
VHSSLILRADIKGDNVLVAEDGTVKLADFNCARRIQGVCSILVELSVSLCLSLSLSFAGVVASL